MAQCCAAAGVNVVRIPSLYDIGADAPIWCQLHELTTPVLLLSDVHPRPAQLLLAGHQLPGLIAVNIADYATAADACNSISEYCAVGAVAGNVVDWTLAVPPRWYPVVDYARCIDCGHCVQFCLFGVYEQAEDGSILVANPDKCKPGCPACSRICPQGAIIFPHYRKDAAIAGAPGLLMQPDAAARRMYYTRTKIACPVCGQLARPGSVGAECCPECGGPVTETVAVKNDEIDDLIDDLEKFARKEL